MDDDIKRCDEIVRECNIKATRSTGFRRWVYLKIADLFSALGDMGREVQRDKQRGDDDNYHGFY